MPELNWSNLGLVYRKTNAIIISRYKDGEWSEPEICGDSDFHINAFAGVFHYGNSCFEGLKAFRGIDSKVRIFRPDENAARIRRSAERLGMAAPSEELFMDMCRLCVMENLDFLPPYGHNASLYIRPVIEGVNPGINICSSDELVFAVMCLPMGSYTQTGTLAPVSAAISRNYDRAAPNGTGSYKIAANYAMSLYPYNLARSQGYKELLFLDPATKTKIDEFGSSNIFVIKNNIFVTPLSDSVLPSITNKSLQTLAKDMGMEVVKREILVEELAEVDEVNACGTAVVITPIKYIDDKLTLESEEISRRYSFLSGDECGEVSRKLYERIRAVQDGAAEDVHNWCLTL